MNEFIVEVTAQNAQQVLIEESMKRPVVVDFWADWCEPCKQLMPVLEKLANEYAGQFLLAKVNADSEQMLAAQLGVRSLPTVLVLKEGQPVDGFAGAQPEKQIREMLDKYLPKPWDLKLAQGQQLVAEGKLTEALPVLRQAYTESSERADIAKQLAAVLLELNRVQEAETVLGKILLADQDSDYQQLMSQLELKQKAAESPEIKALQEALAQNPQDSEAAYKLAIQYSQTHRHQEALDLLLDVLRRDMNFADGAAKQAYLDIVKSLGAGDPLASQYQRKLMTLLY
ncbi:thioredoxin [Microbulbifer thermotolerans]|uniref:Thioredoxin n=1 Tax=Microbulbifer thermotolerans TaxID=252514 RepID=A0A143HN90_MICTH|nr:thioredoxin [Microbulbifer thermotolerans]AMX02971.1 co-chaperone YbbN [Microbulbifer thermotolerans]MCX2779898.1 thioredoxin [Microbulbifer thermotolerans]MCX2781583.1 thioredoxin [Microbulbifer thermotolerans]MCX2794741.1 thioredoxin [Microbulbifer thermotolerans]MCX2802780.1 thioredoxin [Microbulbifer thermotolerans]